MKQVDFALIVFYDDQQRVLLQDRRGYSKWGEEWAFFGGHVETGETHEQAMLREAAEELQCNPEDYEFIGIHQNVHGDLLYYGSVYVAPIGDLREQMVVSEGSGAEFFTLADAKSMRLIPGHDKVIALLERHFADQRFNRA